MERLAFFREEDLGSRENLHIGIRGKTVSFSSNVRVLGNHGKDAFFYHLFME